MELSWALVVGAVALVVALIAYVVYRSRQSSNAAALAALGGGALPPVPPAGSFPVPPVPPPPGPPPSGPPGGGGPPAPPAAPACSTCPDGWAPAPGAPFVCAAPASYAGPCAAALNSKGFTAPLAAAWAARCGNPWTNPCATMGCSTCPDGWTPDPADASVCHAPDGYSGGCNATSTFAGYSPGEAANWAASCGATWTSPCLGAACNACPDGWQQNPSNPSQCIAPPSYSGGCGRTSSFSGYDRQAASNWASACGAKWTLPCNSFP